MPAVISWQGRQAALREGSLAALREGTRLALGGDKRVDVFSIIEDQRIWLMFQPLQRLYGFFAREDDASGIVVHSGHPPSLQRYTAAHEYGHFVLGHRSALDSAQELYDPRDDPQEIAAQAFAADFLMPLPLVNRSMARLGLGDRRDLRASDIYQLSLELGVSYRAAVNQLVALRKIRRENGDKLRKVEPQTIKLELTEGQPLSNPWADVWMIEQPALERRKIEMSSDDELHIRLSEPTTAGYRWGVVHSDLADAILDKTVASGDGQEFGASCLRHLAWRALEAGTREVHLALARPWEEGNISPLKEVRISAHISYRGYKPGQTAASERQRALILATA